jgi:integrase
MCQGQPFTARKMPYPQRLSKCRSFQGSAAVSAIVISGKRFWLYIGLPKTIANRKAAEIKPGTMELDMTSGNFDRSLASYKPQAQSEAISLVEMFDRFTQQKQRTISIGPLAKYLSLQKYVLAFFKGQTSVSVSFIYCRKVSSLFSTEA